MKNKAEKEDIFIPFIELKVILHNESQPECCKKYTRQDIKNFTKKDRKKLNLSKKEIKAALKEKGRYFELSTLSDGKPYLRRLIPIGNIEYYTRGL